MKRTTRFAARSAAALLSLCTGSVMAAGGCVGLNVGNYQIGQTTYVDVATDDPPETVVRTGEATGDGLPLLRCDEGEARFFGEWRARTEPDGTVHLLVDGAPSGYGLRVFVRDGMDGPRHYMPHEFTRSFRQNEEVGSADDYVGYEIVRVGNEQVLFGRIDNSLVAESLVSRPGGAAKQVFRRMYIYSLIFRRPTCSVTPDTLVQTVDMGPYHVGNFATPERATPWIPFRLTMAECKEPVGMIARFTFGTAADVDPVDPTLFSLPADGPENVGLELADADKAAILPGRVWRGNAVAAGKSFEFLARLRETRDTVRGGTFTRPVTVLVEFL